MYIIFFKDSLPLHHREELNQLFFFNPEQKKYIHAIRKQIDQFGKPYIAEKESKLNLLLENTSEVLNLFVLDSDASDAALIGLAVFRYHGEYCDVIHLALHEMCSLPYNNEDQLILFRMLEKLRVLSHKKPGVSKIRLLYKDLTFPVDHQFIQVWV